MWILGSLGNKIALVDGFGTTQKYRDSSATLYSVIETAKACGHAPYKYLKFIFEQFPVLKLDESPRYLLAYILKPDSY